MRDLHTLTVDDAARFERAQHDDGTERPDPGEYLEEPARFETRTAPRPSARECPSCRRAFRPVPSEADRIVCTWCEFQGMAA
jgi:hypothetical protein